MRWIAAFGVLMTAGGAVADTVEVERAVAAAFDNMPRVERLIDLTQLCGAQGEANPDVIYCTSLNTVFLRKNTEAAAYKLAHVMGHAVQVRHGIADVALREITQRRDEEAKLRGWVTRQVECIAGFLLRQAGQPVPNLGAAFDAEPFIGSHWGRSPIRIGPKVSIGLEARQEWLETGYSSGDLSACAVGEFEADLLLEAYKG